MIAGFVGAELRLAACQRTAREARRQGAAARSAAGSGVNPVRASVSERWVDAAIGGAQPPSEQKAS